MLGLIRCVIAKKWYYYIEIFILVMLVISVICTEYPYEKLLFAVSLFFLAIDLLLFLMICYYYKIARF